MINDKSLSDLFEQARNEASEAPASKVLSVLDSAKTSPLAGKHTLRPRRIKKKFNPLKLIIMISPIVILTSVLLILNQESKDIFIKSNESIQLSNPVTVIDRMDNTVQENIIIKAPDSKIGSETGQEPYNVLELSSDVFESLGFTFTESGFNYKFKLDWEWVKFSLGGAGRDEIIPERGVEVHKDSLAPAIYLLTRRENDSDNQDQSSVKTLFWVSPLDSIICGMPMDAAFDLCIPIRISDPAPSENASNYIFWVFPNERFFRCLPAEISNSFREEFYYQKQRLIPDDISKLVRSIDTIEEIDVPDKKNLKKSNIIHKDEVTEIPPEIKSEPVPCNYYSNLCETLPGLDYVTLYPNPASSSINLDMLIQNAKKIRFRVFDLSGRVMIDNGKPENYDQSGKYTYMIDISTLTSGLYMMVMTDEEGARITKRFIKN